eukprot:TRINITY_DN14324_c0_g1_i1.p1 TRINITY_DN14324_c0_g1~~TRINITY_DN14324_c0_g1_i1.p1  ORF type:complete len:339 (-),score=37.47 TRINITY_DN14324_c0_g1_i1:8-1024(-)
MSEKIMPPTTDDGTMLPITDPPSESFCRAPKLREKYTACSSNNPAKSPRLAHSMSKHFGDLITNPPIVSTFNIVCTCPSGTPTDLLAYKISIFISLLAFCKQRNQCAVLLLGDDKRGIKAVNYFASRLGIGSVVIGRNSTKQSLHAEIVQSPLPVRCFVAQFGNFEVSLTFASHIVFLDEPSAPDEAKAMLAAVLTRTNSINFYHLVGLSAATDSQGVLYTARQGIQPAMGTIGDDFIRFLVGITENPGCRPIYPCLSERKCHIIDNAPSVNMNAVLGQASLAVVMITVAQCVPLGTWVKSIAPYKLGEIKRKRQREGEPELPQKDKQKRTETGQKPS